MNKIISIVFILLIFGLILSGCSSNNVQTQPTQVLHNKDVKPQEEKAGLNLDNEKYGDLIKLHCEDYETLKGKYLGKEAENQCYYDIAVATKDESLCELMIDSELETKQEAKEWCLARVWGKLVKPEKCNTLSLQEAAQLCLADAEYNDKAD